MDLKEFKALVRHDLYRYEGDSSAASFRRTWRYESGFRFTVLMRLCRLLHGHPLTRYGLYHIVAFFYHRASIRHGIQINLSTQIGGGLYIPHLLNIIVHRDRTIGRNCNLSHGVTIGAGHRGARAGTPVVGNNVFIGPGAVVFGKVRIGNTSAIGANCVVNRDLEEQSMVIALPGRELGMKGSEGYISNLPPEDSDSQVSESDPSN